jgi:hypothetical protein
MEIQPYNLFGPEAQDEHTMMGRDALQEIV